MKKQFENCYIVTLTRFPGDFRNKLDDSCIKLVSSVYKHKLLGEMNFVPKGISSNKYIVCIIEGSTIYKPLIEKNILFIDLSVLIYGSYCESNNSREILELIFGKQGSNKKDVTDILSDTYFIFLTNHLKWTNIVKLFSLLNIIITQGSNTNRGHLSTTQYELSLYLSGLLVSKEDIYKSMMVLREERVSSKKLLDQLNDYRFKEIVSLIKQKADLINRDIQDKQLDIDKVNKLLNREKIILEEMFGKTKILHKLSEIESNKILSWIEEIKKNRKNKKNFTATSITEK